MKHVIIEYGVGEGTYNPTSFVPTSNWALASSRHMTKIATVIRHFCNYDVEIISLPLSYAEKWLEENWQDVWTISASVGTFLNDSWLAKYKHCIYMAASSGNEGIDSVGGNAKKDWWTSIGAIDYQLRPTYYSSYTSDSYDIDYAGMAGYTLEFDYKGEHFKEQFHGTSYSCPQHVSEVLNLMGDYYTTYGRKPRIDEILASLDKYAQDVHTPGIDFQTGKGYFEHTKGKYVMEFKDQALISDWAVTAVNKAKVLGILKGDENGNVNPKSSVTLEQLMVILDRIGTLGE